MVSGDIKQTLKNNQYAIAFVVVLVMFIFLLTATFVYAQSVWNPLNWWGFIQARILSIVHALLVSVPALLVWITGGLLNVTIIYLVVQMGDLINQDTGIGFAINGLWRVIRDVMNIAFIFGLVYIGIKTILNAEDSGTRKSLIQLIGAALLINFSLFIAKMIVDFGNIAASQIFVLFSTTSSVALGQTGTFGVSGAFIHALGVLSFLTNDSIFDNLSLTASLVYSFLSMIFLLITAVVFAVGAFMLLARFIALIFYMIFSPAMFLGWVIPYFAKDASAWWSGFLRYTFFAPAFLFCLYLSYVVLERMRVWIINEGQPADLATTLIGGAGQASSLLVILSFCISAGMLWASAVVANRMSIVGAQSSVAFMQNVRTGLQGYMYRNTVGLATDKALKLYDAADRAYARDEAKDSQRSWMGRRGAEMKRTALKLVTTGGAMIPSEETRRGIQSVRNYGAGGVGLAAAEKANDERKVRIGIEQDKSNLKDAIRTFTQDKEGGTNREDMERDVRDASTASILELAKDSRTIAMLKEVAGELSESQWKALQDDKELDIGTKNELAAKRSEQVVERISRLNGGKPIQDVLYKASTTELKAIGTQKLSEIKYQDADGNEFTGVEDYLTDKQISDWKDLTPTEKSQLKNNRKKKLLTLAGMNPDNARPEDANDAGVTVVFERFKSDKERAELPEEILRSTSAAKHLNTNTLTKIVDNDDIDDVVRRDIKGKVLAHHQANVDQWRGNANPTPEQQEEMNRVAKQFEKYEDYFNKNNMGQRY